MYGSDDGLFNQVVEEGVIWVLEVIVNNAHIVYKIHTSNSRKLTMKEFRRQLAVQLCRDICRGDAGGSSRTDQSWRGYVASTFSKKAAREETVVCAVIAILGVKERWSTPSVSHALTIHHSVLGTASKSTTHVQPSSCIYWLVSTHLLHEIYACRITSHVHHCCFFRPL